MTAEPIDFGLAAILLVVIWKTLFSRDQLAAITFFIAAGLVVSLIWARLGAYDVAMAEAAVGAGVTGSLLIITWNRLPLEGHPSISYWTYAAVIAVGIVMTGLLLITFQFSPVAGPGLAQQVESGLYLSGVKNPVTAVLLNYRGFDTLLEIAVLFITLVGTTALGIKRSALAERVAHSPVIEMVLRFTLPLCILIGAYLLWTGADTPGGAFQAGAVWAGALILLQLSTHHLAWLQQYRILTVIGLLSFILVALILLIVNGNVLQYPPAHAGNLIFVIETAAAVSIAVTLYLLFTLGDSATSGERE